MPPGPGAGVRALVTGAGGFVGANLARYLRTAGHEVLAVVRPGRPPWRLQDAGAGIALVEVDLARPPGVRAAVLEHRPDWIFHVAAHGSYSWQTDLRAMTAVNVEATDALLAAARDAGAQALVYAGSSSEYGHQDHPPAEDERIEPNSHYAVTKAAGTHLCRLAAATHGQRAPTLRLYSVYGPWEDPNRLMPTLVERALRDSWPPLVDPHTARDFVWVDDVCDAFVRAAVVPLDDPGAVFNVGSGRQATLREVVAAAREVFDVGAEPDWGSMPQRAWDTTVWVADPSAAAQVLGWRATTSLDKGLRRLGAWLREHPELAARYRPAG
jgi:UDP-glucose 4-epimerase